MPDEVASDEMEGFLAGWALRHGWVGEQELGVAERIMASDRQAATVPAALRAAGFIDGEQADELTLVSEVTRAVPRFALIRKLGAGGAGSVFEAEDRKSGEVVALKVLHSALANREDQQIRFEREAQALGSIQHPSIPRLVAHGIRHGITYLAMEYVRGTTLSDLVGPDRTLPETYVLWAAAQVAQALHHAHVQGGGIIHRDLKPQNIIIQIPDNAGADGRLATRWPIKIIDFGLVRREHEDSQLTLTGTVLGTPRYMPPEQVRAEALDWRADLYALGGTMFHLLTGRPPFDAPTPAAVLAAHLNDPVPDPGRLMPNLSARTCRLVMRCLAKDREARGTSWTDFIEACDVALAALANRPRNHPAATPAGTKPQTRPVTNRHTRPPAEMGTTPRTEAGAGEGSAVRVLADALKARVRGELSDADIPDAVAGSGVNPAPPRSLTPIATPRPIAKPVPTESGRLNTGTGAGPWIALTVVILVAVGALIASGVIVVR